MQIIAHRGGSGTVLENTLESVRRAMDNNANEIEIDIRLTKDGHFVLCHDRTLERVSGQKLSIQDSTLKQLQAVTLSNGESVPTLVDVLQLVKPGTLVVEAKSAEWASKLADALKGYEPKVHSVIAFNHKELAQFHRYKPEIKAYSLAFFNPFGAISAAGKHEFQGIGIAYWLLNPLSYWLAKQAKLEIFVYTIDHVWLARVLTTLYPDISIATNYPDKLAVLAER